MKRKVIIDLPKGQSGLEVKMKNLRAGLGFNANTMPWPIMAGKMSEPDMQVKSTLSPVPRDEANLEAEKGEVAALPTKSGIPDTYTIGGKRHYAGGTPLNLPTDSFIFSDTAKMRIKDTVVLAQFGMPERKSGYTPAEIAKKYNVAPFKKILLDKNTDNLQKQTAELMISNYNLKLAKLALVQESMKGFPQGIPLIAMPYIESMQINPEEFVQMNPGQGDASAQQEEAGSTMAYGGDVDYFAPGGAIHYTTEAEYQKGLLNKNKSAEQIAAEKEWALKKVAAAKATTTAPKLPSDLGFYSAEAANTFGAAYPTDYGTFKKAYAADRNTPEGKQYMLDVAAQLENKEVPNSWGWIPWSDQDKFQDLAGILRERAAFEDVKTAQATPEYQAKIIDTEAGKKATEMYTNAIKQRDLLAKQDPYSPKVLELNNTIDKLVLYQPSIKAKYPYKKQSVIPQTGEIRPFQAYSDDDLKELNAMYSAMNAAPPATVLPVGQTNETVPTDQDAEAAAAEKRLAEGKAAPVQKTQVEQPVKTTATPAAKPAAKQYRVVQSNEDFAMGGSTGKKRVVIEYAGGGELRKAADGDAGKTITDEYDELNKSGTKQRHVIVYSDGTVSKGEAVAITVKPGTPEEEKIRQEKASAKTNTVVTKEQYDELMDLYSKAEAANTKNPGKKNPETETFQKKYHEYLGDEAQRIISADPEKTTKGKKEGLAWYDLKSNEDGIFGRRTKQYLEGLQKYKPEETTPGVVPTPPLKDEKKKEEVGPEGVIVSHGDQDKERKLPPVRPEWWLQDKIKALNAGLNYMGIKAYNPWQAQATYMTPRTTYLSPERALAENQSQMRTAMDSLAQFSGPQQFNARMSEIYGKGFANAANTIADVHNRNVQLFNQNAAQEANIKNTEARERAAGATNLWDKYQTVRQNFDTAKANARDVLANTVIQGITNRANTYNLNQLYPQYAINPNTGGMMYFHDPRDLKPGQEATPISKRYQKMLSDNPTLAASEEGQKRLWEMTKIEAGMPGDDPMAEYQRSRQRGAGNQTPVPGYGS